MVITDPIRLVALRRLWPTYAEQYGLPAWDSVDEETKIQIARRIFP